MTIYWQGGAAREQDFPLSEDERAARVQLAAAYRIFDHLGWTEMIFNHITLRVLGSEKLFLINPFGLHYREVTASNLVLIDLEGNPVRATPWPVNRAGFMIHSALHGANPQVQCVMHTHTTTGMAVACLQEGLSPANFYAAQLQGQVAYHEFEGITVEPGEKSRLIADIGSKRAVILRNHGLLTWGASVPEAFLQLWTLQRACDVQIAAASAGALQPIRREVFEQTVRESGPGEQRTCEDVFAAMQRIVDEKDPSYRN
ncbi:MAG: class II aldolase [Betaproteobacteria bacterium RIFCSPLOWO2_02_67_12]|nr:MAG: class II aldolase [Betaproteobacteria bacterium RIFCSPLOWO2_02_67_12]OGA30788.1 MAG: class II aldolase [Betaproteobacteria bacterium RIFCSPLOWO2_02_FULL_68_150]OGA69974.1 MAG: class II aldolase [Betaproteobacteria bacterium RIFCSPLOWO2_12_FULL_67_28]